MSRTMSNGGVFKNQYRSTYFHCRGCIHQSEWVTFVPAWLSHCCMTHFLCYQQTARPLAWELNSLKETILNLLLIESLNVIQLPANLQTSSIFSRLFLTFLLIAFAAWLDLIRFILLCFEKELNASSSNHYVSPPTPCTGWVEQRGDLIGIFHPMILIFKT